MKILVTGCAGFIGFHLCQEILNSKKNIKVIGVDNINDYYSQSLKNKRLQILKKNKRFKFYKINISNYKNLDLLFKKNKFKYIINLAAQAGVRYSISNPRDYVSSNIVGFFNLAELSRIYKVKKILYASSSSVYGEKKIFPLKESNKIYPKNIYSLSKKNNEEIAEIYSNYYNIKFIGLRLFTVYGEWGRPDMLILKYILSKFSRKKFYLNNYGKHYRDFTYISDVIKNIIILTNKNFKNKNTIINVCYGKPVSLKIILDKLDSVFGKPKIIQRSKQLADVYKTHGSNSKLKKITGFKNYTNIDIGLKKLINWAMKNKKFLSKI